MGNIINNLANNRNKIRQLMAMDSDGTMDSIVENAIENKQFSVDGDGFQYNSPSSNKSIGIKPIEINEEVVQRHSKMPKSIIESFKKDPGNTPDYNPSILSRLPQEMFNEDVPQQTINKPKLKESKQTQQVQQSPVIDYSLIKTIVNESVQENVKKYMSALSKKLISEGVGTNNSNDLIAMKAGKTFSFIDKQGNVYECTLKKKGNVNNIQE
jgi:hypothetical protein